MTIIEKSIVAKSPTMSSEDGIAITDGLVAVVDGSTSKTARQLHPGKTNGRLCMELVCQYVSTVSRDIGLEGFCKGVTELVCSQYDSQQMKVAIHHKEERMAASCIVYSEAHREIWMIGDCQCLVDGTLYENPKSYEASLAEKRSIEAHRLIDSGQQTKSQLQQQDISRQSIIAEMLDAMKGQNTEYAVIDGFPIAMKGVLKLKLPSDAQTIILASDGYPFLLSSLAESEAALARQLSTDPLCIDTYKATKGLMHGNISFDDRAYIKILV